MLIECTTLFGNKKMIPLEKIIFRPSAYGIIINDGKILLLSSKNTGKYWFPGGGIELNETLEEGIKREVKEETGIEAEVKKFFYFKELFFYHEFFDEAYHSFLFFYLCRPKTLNLIDDDNVDDGESEKPRWIDLKTLKKEDFQVGVEEVLEPLFDGNLCF